MDLIDVKRLPPGDPKLIDSIVNLMKCQGIFDELRRDSLADVDTTPAYQNLRHRVEGFVEDYLKDTQWRSDLNKNQLRDAVRRNINDSEMLTTGVDRIVDQVVTPKIHQVFLPKVTEIVHKFLGIDRKVTSDIQPKDETDGNLVTVGSAKDSSSGESLTNLVLSVESHKGSSSVISSAKEKVDTTSTTPKKVSKEQKDDHVKGTTAKAVSESQNAANKKQEQKLDSKTKTSPSDKSKSKVDLAQKKVVSSSSVKVKTTDVKAIKGKVLTDKLKSTSKSKDQESSSSSTKDGPKSISDSKDIKSSKLTATKTKASDDKTKSEKPVKTEKSKFDSEKAKADISKTEKGIKEAGKTKFSSSSRFRSLGSNSRKEKTKDEKANKESLKKDDVIKAKSVVIPKSVDTKAKSFSEPTPEKSSKEELLPSKTSDKPKLERSSSSGHKRTSSESKNSKVGADVSSSKMNKATKSHSSQKDEKCKESVSDMLRKDSESEAFKEQILNKEAKKEKLGCDETRQQKKSGISKKMALDCDENASLDDGLPPNEVVSLSNYSEIRDTDPSIEDYKLSFRDEDGGRNASPITMDSESESSPEVPSPRKARKRKGKKMDKDGRRISDDDMSDITVSSVHTSDLSDFDDNITLTESDNEEEKKVELKKRNAEIIVDRWDVECTVEHLLQTVEEEMATKAVTAALPFQEVDTDQEKPVDYSERQQVSDKQISKLANKLEPHRSGQRLEPKDEDWKPTRRKRSTPTAKLETSKQQKQPRSETEPERLERESEPDRSEKELDREPRREMRRQRRLNPRYASDDFSSIFSRGSREQNPFYEVSCRGDFVEAQAPIRGRRLTGHSNTTDETDCALSPVSDFSEFGDVGKSRKLSVGSRGKLCSPSEGSECSDYSRSRETSTPDQSDNAELRPQTSSVSVAERKSKRECSKSPVEPSLVSSKMEGPSTRRHSRSEVIHNSPTATRQKRAQRADRQRYDSTDLYKPRAAFSSSRRFRGMSSSAAREEAIDQRETLQTAGRSRGRSSSDAPTSPRGSKRSAPPPSSTYSIKRRCRV